MPVHVYDSAVAAIEGALTEARKGELVVILADNVKRAIEIVSRFREQLTPVTVMHEDIPNQVV